MEKTGFFEEVPGKKSSMRLVFICGNFYAMAMGAWVFATTHEFGSSIAMVTAMAATFGASKLLQNVQENKAQS